MMVEWKMLIKRLWTWTILLIFDHLRPRDGLIMLF